MKIDMPEENEKKMQLWEHLEELRWAILKMLAILTLSTLLCLIFVENILEIVMYPLNELILESNVVLNQQGPFDGIFIKMKVGFFGGLILGAPFALSALWAFVSPGLQKREVRLFLPMSILATALFVGGLLCGFFTLSSVLPLLISFSVEKAENIWLLKEYINFVVRWVLCAGLVFELPVIVLVIAKLGLVEISTLRKGRPYAIIIALVLAAFLTPPDPVTQLMVGIPMILLYELGILLAYFAIRGNNNKSEFQNSA